MRRPDISTKLTDPDLVGSEGKSSWMRGRNCVYMDSDVAEYRVSVRTSAGWRLYGHFNDLETASYVANVAILAERCDDRYELNSVGAKDVKELKIWRSIGQNAELERLARQRFNEIKEELDKIQADQRRIQENYAAQAARLNAEAEKESARVEALKLRQQEEEAALIKNAPTASLLNLLSRDISGEQYRKIRAELHRRSR
jgi:hypothetical protein